VAKKKEVQPPPQLYTEADKERPKPEASKSAEGVRGRPYRSAWQRDRARLLHCPSFRRLQGKTQLFPSPESDFFRNRLTHSLEVAQIAKVIAIKANSSGVLGDLPIDLDLIEFAGLAHDLGHPPFGHNGEEALHELMKGKGGFEGNAQTLRILSVLEKKVTATDLPLGFSANKDQRRGLNLTLRALAAILKYDQVISTNASAFTKGYYASEARLVETIKDRVAGYARPKVGEFKTIECQIMDIADDIAYSTYDLEDSFKAGFLHPLEMLALLGNQAFRSNLQREVERAIQRIAKDSKFRISEGEIYKELSAVFRATFTSRMDPAQALEASNNVAQNGYLRTQFTAGLVDEFVQGVQFKPDGKCPPLSVAFLTLPVLRRVEILKRFTFLALIMSPRLQIANVRGKEIIRSIFEALNEPSGWRLLPPDVQEAYEKAKIKHAKLRVLCDFIASMTDRYAVEFYSRIKSASGLTIFKPH